MSSHYGASAATNPGVTWGYQLLETQFGEWPDREREVVWRLAVHRRKLQSEWPLEGDWMVGVNSGIFQPVKWRTGPVRRRGRVMSWGKRSDRRISGFTRDAGGTIVGGCTVECYYTAANNWGPQDSARQTVVSAADGSYSFGVPDTTTTYYLVAYKTGSPDSFGTTVNTLTGS